jgi:hypothetical protein
MQNTHPLDTRSSSLIRYCVTPVMDITSAAAEKPLLVIFYIYSLGVSLKHCMRMPV